jgi:hypothetical protein
MVCLFFVQVYSKTLIDTININRWRVVDMSDHVRLSCVGHSLHQMLLRLIRIASTLHYMQSLSKQTIHLAVSQIQRIL